MRYYLITRDKPSDNCPEIEGPFNSLEKAKKFAESECEPTFIFSIVSIADDGEANCEAYFNGSNHWNWFDLH